MHRPPFQQFRLTVEPLSPLHVGSGDTIEPYQYDLVETPHRGELVAYDLDRLLSDLPPAARRELDALLEQNDFVRLRAWLRRAADPVGHRRFAVWVARDPFIQIRKHLDDPARLGEVHLFTRHAGTGRPYLPGSSIKGAIRTAVVDRLARARPELRQTLERIADSHERWAGPRFEAVALGSARGGDQPDLYLDPFRDLAISDLELPEDSTYIDQMQIVGRAAGRRQQAAGIVIYREVTRSAMAGDTLQVRGQLRLREPRGHDAAGRAGLEVSEVLAACNNFYRARLAEELQRFGDVVDSDALRQCAAGLGPRDCLVRVGRHSHFECVTVGPPYCRPPRRGFGKSRTYAQGMLPLGWVRLSFEPAGGSA